MERQYIIIVTFLYYFLDDSFRSGCPIYSTKHFVCLFSTILLGTRKRVRIGDIVWPSLTHIFSTILLGTRKMVRIGSIGLALSDPHFCILSREYLSLWAIKTSLDRDASALLYPEVLFSRVVRHLACLAFCKLQVGIFQRSVIVRGY